MQASQPRTDRASRCIQAPREQVFEALIDGEVVAAWLPPTGARAILEAFDPRPGGAFRMTLVFNGEAGVPTGKTSETSDSVDGKFVEIIAPRLVVQQFTFLSDKPEFAGTMKMTWSLAETDGGTLVTIAAEGVPGGISPDEHQAGMTSSLANLTSYLESKRPPAAR
jgi:uncharacterized protein YndB with AHSA1/START domain